MTFMRSMRQCSAASAITGSSVADGLDHAGGELLRERRDGRPTASTVCESSCSQNVVNTSSSDERPTSH